MRKNIDDAAKIFNEAMHGIHGEKWKNYLRPNPKEIAKNFRAAFSKMTIEEFDSGIEFLAAGKFGSKIPTPTQFVELTRSILSEIKLPEEELNRGCGLPITDTEIVQLRSNLGPNLQAITLVRDCEEEEIDDPYKKPPVHIKESPKDAKSVPNYIEYITEVSSFPEGGNHNQNRAIEAAKNIIEKLKKGESVQAIKCMMDGCKNWSVGKDKYLKQSCYLHYI